MPERIQRKRTKGWRMPEGAVYVGRGTRWGNPFQVTEDRAPDEAKIAYMTWLAVDTCHANMLERKRAILDNLAELRGKDLMCWCPLGQPCHADVLLEVANV